MEYQPSRNYTLYIGHSCPVCVDCQSILQSVSIEYTQYYITASSKPGRLDVWLDEGPVEIPKEMIPLVPAFYDRDKNTLVCGLQGIESYVAGLTQ